MLCRHYYCTNTICIQNLEASASCSPTTIELRLIETVSAGCSLNHARSPGMFGKACVFAACLCTSVSAFNTLPSRPAVTFGTRHRSNVAAASPQHGLHATDHATRAARTGPVHMQQFNLPRGGGGFEASSLIGPAVFAGLFFSGALGWIFNFVIGFQAPLHLCASSPLHFCACAPPLHAMHTCTP